MECGATGEAASRDAARVAYKEHRAAHRKGPKAVPAPKAAKAAKAAKAPKAAKAVKASKKAARPSGRVRWSLTPEQAAGVLDRVRKGGLLLDEWKTCFKLASPTTLRVELQRHVTMKEYRDVVLVGAEVRKAARAAASA
jgi:hypothetical protein